MPNGGKYTAKDLKVGKQFKPWNGWWWATITSIQRSGKYLCIDGKFPNGGFCTVYRLPDEKVEMR